jgi:molybdopterin synthase catalytic subunit
MAAQIVRRLAARTGAAFAWGMRHHPFYLVEVSFGMTSYLTDRPIDVPALIAEASSPACGAVIIFLGTVRSSPEDGAIEGIEYSAYPEMAEKEFEAIVAEAAGRWPDARIVLRHRTGYILTAEASIAIVVAMPHRGEAYECSRYVIEETKKRVPIWKKERFAGGGTKWV